MKDPRKVKIGDYIAFSYTKAGGGKDLVIEAIDAINPKYGYLSRFMYGYKSEAEYVKPDEVLAIGNMDAESGLKGSSGRFDLIKPDHPLIVKNLKPLNTVR